MVERACDGLLEEIQARPPARRERGARSPRRRGRSARRSSGSAPVGGGDINEAWRLELEDGGARLPEVAGRRARGRVRRRGGRPRAGCGEPDGLPVPEVLAVVDEDGERGLVLEWIERGPAGRRRGGGARSRARGRSTGAGADAFDALPAGLAARAARVSAGSRCPVRPSAADAPGPIATRVRLELLRAGRSRFDSCNADRHHVATRTHSTTVVDRLDDARRPAEPPARIHGDLWSGNVHAGADGRPWLIDPAAHGAHREMDLAMLDLFGSISARTLAAYEEVWPLAAEWRERARPLAAPAAARPRDPLRRLLRRGGRAGRGRLRLRRVAPAVPAGRPRPQPARSLAPDSLDAPAEIELVRERARSRPDRRPRRASCALGLPGDSGALDLQPVTPTAPERLGAAIDELAAPTRRRASAPGRSGVPGDDAGGQRSCWTARPRPRQLAAGDGARARRPARAARELPAGRVEPVEPAPGGARPRSTTSRTGSGRRRWASALTGSLPLPVDSAVAVWDGEPVACAAAIDVGRRRRDHRCRDDPRAKRQRSRRALIHSLLAGAP